MNNLLHSSFIFGDTFRNDGQRFHCIKHYIYHYATSRETLIRDSDVSQTIEHGTDTSNSNLANKLLVIF
jgi:hypothetical protein